MSIIDGHWLMQVPTQGISSSSGNVPGFHSHQDTAIAVDGSWLVPTHWVTLHLDKYGGAERHQAHPLLQTLRGRPPGPGGPSTPAPESEPVRDGVLFTVIEISFIFYTLHSLKGLHPQTILSWFGETQTGTEMKMHRTATGGVSRGWRGLAESSHVHPGSGSVTRSTQTLRCQCA